MNYAINESIDEIEEDLDELMKLVKFLGFKNAERRIKHIRFNLANISDDMHGFLTEEREGFEEEILRLKRLAK